MHRYAALASWTTVTAGAALLTVWSGPATAILGGLLVVGGVAAGVGSAAAGWRPRIAAESPTVERRRVPSPEQVVAAAGSASGMGPAEAVRFLERLARPQSHFTRIAEDVRVQQRLLDARIACTVRLQGPPGSVAVVPVLRRTKGIGEERIAVEDRGGKPLVPLPPESAVGTVVRAVEIVLSSLAVGAVEAFHEDARQAFIALATSPTPVDTEAAVRALDRVPGVADGGAARALLVDVCHEVAAFTHVCVVTEVEGQPTLLRTGGGASADVVDATFHVERSVIPRYRRGVRATFVDRVRTLFGITPTKFFWSLDGAGRAQQYQLDLIGPPHSYLARQQVVGERAEPVELDGRVVAVARRGQESAHLVVETRRSTSGSVFVADYFERTPTSLGPAAVAALALLLVMLTGSLTVVDADPLIGQGSFAGLLLGLPSAISVWSGVQALNREHPGVLLARVFTIWTILLALIAAGASLGIEQKHASSVFDLPSWWMLIVLLALAHVAFTMTSWILRSAVYSRFIEGRPLRTLEDRSH